jgi:outer membrane lipoprotein SlyB
MEAAIGIIVIIVLACVVFAKIIPADFAEDRRTRLLRMAERDLKKRGGPAIKGWTTIQSGGPVAPSVRDENVMSATLDISYVGQSKANLGSAVGRAAVGGLVAGPIGAAAGAVTGSRTERQMITGIKVHVTGKDGSHRTVTFYSGGPKTEGELAQQLDDARKAVAKLTAAAG